MNPNIDMQDMAYIRKDLKKNNKKERKNRMKEVKRTAKANLGAGKK